MIFAYIGMATSAKLWSELWIRVVITFMHASDDYIAKMQDVFRLWQGCYTDLTYCRLASQFLVCDT